MNTLAVISIVLVVVMATVHGNEGDDVIQKRSPLPIIWYKKIYKKKLGEPCVRDSECHFGKQCRENENGDEVCSVVMAKGHSCKTHLCKRDLQCNDSKICE